MLTNKEIGMLLLYLNNTYYEKGMSKITIPIKGIRNEKIASANRKAVISQLIRSQSNDEFFKQFLSNLKDEFNELRTNEDVKKIIENPQKNVVLIDKCDKELLCLYLITLHDEKYDEIIRKLMECICNDHHGKKKKEEIDNLKIEVEEYKKINQEYFQEILKLKEISNQRKTKIKEVETKNIFLFEANQKLQKEINSLLEKIEEMSKQLKEYELRSNTINNKNGNKQSSVHTEGKDIIALIGSEKILTDGNSKILELDTNKYLENQDYQEFEFAEILVCKKNIQISKLRKIKKMSENRAKFFDSEKDVINYLKVMELLV